MKKVLTLALAALMAAASMIVPSAAVENKVVYAEDFSTVKTLEEAGWEKIETLKECTGSWTIEDGHLVIDNRKDDTKNPTSNDSYWVVVPKSIMADVVKDDYTVQWDMTYLDAGDAARYIVLLLNYDREMGNSYLSFHFRPKGYADFQTRLFGSWTTIDTAGSTEGNITRPKAGNTDPANGDPICKYLWGKDYVDSKTYLIMNEPITVRIEYHAGKCLKVFMNDKFVTATDDAGWENYSLLADPVDGFCEIAIKAGTTIYGTVDNIVVATGIGIPADAFGGQTETTKAPETTAAPTTTTADDTTAPATETPDTADMTAIYAMAAMMLAAVVALAAKKVRAK